jgi:MFS family permease
LTTADRDATSADPSGEASWMPLVVVCLALGAEAYDASSIPVAISAIVTSLSTDLSTIQAALVLFSVICAPLMLMAGTLGDIHGRRRIFRLGALLFGTGALIAALAPHVAAFFLGFSVIKALGAVLIVPTGAALLVTGYEGRRRAIAFGFLGAFLAGATAATPMIMGAITTLLGWRFGYGLSVLLAALVLLLSGRLTESDRKSGAVDWFGVILALLGLGSIMLGATAAGTYGWWLARRELVIAGTRIAPFGLSVTPFLIAIGAVLLVVFFNWGDRQERRGRLPILRRRLFDNIRYTSGVAVGALQIIGVAGLLFVIPVYLQSALGYDALRTGLTLLPYTLALLAASLASSVLVRWFRPKHLIQLALVMMVAGLILLAVMVHPGMTPTTLILPLVVYGVAAGLAASLLPNTTLSSVDPGETGEASSAQEAASEMGSGFGAAVIGAVLIAATWTGLVDGIAAKADWPLDRDQRKRLAIQIEDAEKTWTPEDKREFIADLPAEVRKSIDDIVVKADTEALRDSLLVILIVILLALLGSVFLSAKRPEESGGP